MTSLLKMHTRNSKHNNGTKTKPKKSVFFFSLSHSSSSSSPTFGIGCVVCLTSVFNPRANQPAFNNTRRQTIQWRDLFPPPKKQKKWSTSVWILVANQCGDIFSINARFSLEELVANQRKMCPETPQRQAGWWRWAADFFPFKRTITKTEQNRVRASEQTTLRGVGGGGGNVQKKKKNEKGGFTIWKGIKL